MAKRKETLNINNAIIEGIDSIIEKHPRFEGFEEYLSKHIDKKKIRENLQYLGNKVKKLRLNKERKNEYIFKEIADYISSGEAFDKRGKSIILKKGLERKTGLRNYLQFPGLQEMFPFIKFKPKFEGEKYMDKTMEAFNDLYTLFKSGDYARRMPELTESIETLYDFRFLNPAVDLLKEYGMINERKYNFLKKKIYSQAKEAPKKIVEGIEKYVVPQKVAASILGIFGIALIAVSSKITGAVVGVSNETISCIVGVCMIIGSLLLIFKLSKKKIKK